MALSLLAFSKDQTVALSLLAFSKDQTVPFSLQAFSKDQTMVLSLLTLSNDQTCGSKLTCAFRKLASWPYERMYYPSGFLKELTILADGREK